MPLSVCVAARSRQRTRRPNARAGPTQRRSTVAAAESWPAEVAKYRKGSHTPVMASGGHRENAGRRRTCIACGNTIHKGEKAYRVSESLGGFHTHGSIIGWLCLKDGQAALSFVWHLRARAVG